MAAENPLWGEERIANELLVKLGIRVSPRTVGKYVPKRPPGQPLVAGQSGAPTLVALGLADPAAQRLCRAADLLRDRGDRRPLRRMLVLVLKDQPNCPLPDLR
jgi:hypothetical protein